ncbi:MAG TPA: hypothetical protein VGB26_13105 [Nitrospiria bacterium]|jgi:hypothetical protein
MFSLPGDILYAVAAGLGMLAWAFIFGYSLFSTNPPAQEMEQEVPEEAMPIPLKKAA